MGIGGHRPSILAPHWDSLEVAGLEQPDIALQALCDRLAVERGVKAVTGMMSRFFRREGITVRERPSRRLSATARTCVVAVLKGANSTAASIPRAWSSLTRPRPEPT